jgi:sulfite oxidase
VPWVSVDKGQSWQPAKFDVPASPYAWYLWKAEGNTQVWRPRDLGTGHRRSWPQPTLDGKIFWNPNGYEWTGVFKNEVVVV